MDGLRTGDILAGNCPGVFDWSLNKALSVFYPEWRGREFQPCHLRIAWKPVPFRSDLFFTIDATRNGVLPGIIEKTDPLWRNYHWLELTPFPKEFDEWLAGYIGKPYDFDEYFKTLWFVLAGKDGWYTAPYDNNKKYHCWELACNFVYDFGKPLKQRNEPPVIVKIAQRLEMGR